MSSKNKKNLVLNGSPAAATTERSFAAAGQSIRTPWGVVDASRHDEDARDPFEPDDPISLFPKKGGPGDPPAVTPRELFEMLMTPAAQPSRSPTRSSPVRSSGAGLLEVSPSGNSTALPPQADMVLSALEAGRAAAPGQDRRVQSRKTYRVRATLRLYSDQNGATPWVVFTRDLHSRGVGFITQHRLPLGYGGVIEIPDPKGGATPLALSGTLLRCREAGSGWFEGSLFFSREQPELNEL